MASFVANGHAVRLHVYDEPANVPHGVTLADASEVLPREHLFAHRQSGSFALFADWFRYRLLRDRGGLWVDTDVVCLKPLDYGGEEIYGWQDGQTLNNAVLGLPRGHRLAEWMASVCEHPNRFLPYDSSKTRRRKLQRMLLRQHRADAAWGETGPQGLTAAARHLDCTASALPFWHFYPIHYMNWQTVFDGTLPADAPLVAGSYALHLWNEMARQERGFDKNRRYSPDCLFERLCARYLPDA